jgi:hypothetical protein
MLVAGAGTVPIFFYRWRSDWPCSVATRRVPAPAVELVFDVPEKIFPGSIPNKTDGCRLGAGGVEDEQPCDRWRLGA